MRNISRSARCQPRKKRLLARFFTLGEQTEEAETIGEAPTSEGGVESEKVDLLEIDL